MQIILVLVVGVATFLLFLLIFLIFGRPPGEDVRKRMEAYLAESQMAAKDYAPEDEPTPEEKAIDSGDTEGDWVKEMRGEKGASFGKKLLANVGTIITPKGLATRIAKNLAKADIPLKANEFVAIQFLSVVFPLIFGLVILQSIVFGVLFAVIGYFIPLIWIAIKKSKRVAAFNGQILDTLIMLANGMKAGYSFLQAMEMVAREAPPPMSSELKRVLKENSLGLNLEDCLNALNERVESEDWDLVTTVVLIQRQVGGNLAEILDKIGFTIRQRMKIKGDIQTKTAQAKVSGLLVGVLPFGIGIMIYLLNPEFIMSLFTFKRGGFRGWFVVVFGLFWEVIGMIVIMKIVDIEV
ncbi:type II secretion system F family protein [bacterium]|nr:type II secretion system F family protein [bacterium]